MAGDGNFNRGISFFSFPFMLFSQVVPVSFSFLSVSMTIQIKQTLSKTRNPLELGFTLNKRLGECIQVVGDGWCLIKVRDLYIKKMVKINGKNTFKLFQLEWYVHENDFRFLSS